MNGKAEVQAKELAAIDQDMLKPLVRSALNSDTLEVANWECKQLHGGIGLGTAIHRFSGQALEDTVFEGYLKGLSDAGWQGDPRQVRLGYTAASIRWRFAEINRAMEMILDESKHAFMEQVFGRSMEEIESHFAQVMSLVDSLTAEARELMKTVG